MLVLPSRAEGTPLSLLEAMAFGRPAVVTNVGGNADWVDHGQTGFVAAAPTVDLLAVALDACWAAHAHWRKMGSAGYNALVERYDPTPGLSLLRLLQKAGGAAAYDPEDVGDS